MLKIGATVIQLSKTELCNYGRNSVSKEFISDQQPGDSSNGRNM